MAIRVGLDVGAAAAGTVGVDDGAETWRSRVGAEVAIGGAEAGLEVAVGATVGDVDRWGVDVGCVTLIVTS
jgi:hypothetical protein